MIVRSSSKTWCQWRDIWCILLQCDFISHFHDWKASIFYL